MQRQARSVLLLWSFAALGCDPGEPFDVPSNITELTVAEAKAMDTAIDGQTVRMRGLVVLAQDRFDEVSNGNVGSLYVTDPGNEPGHALQMFAPQVRLHAYEELQPGNLIDAQGPFVRFTGPPGFVFDGGRYLDQFSFGTSVERVGFWSAEEPIQLDVASWQREPQQYLHNLIELTDPLIATSGYEVRVSESSGRPRLEPFTADTMGGLEVRVSGELYRIPDMRAGVRILRIRGIANYFFDDTIMPRGPQDVELEAP
jgi:hypothetical protein